MATDEQIQTAARLLNQARARRDSHYPDAAAAAAEAVPHPGPERDAAEARIRAIWDQAIATHAPEVSAATNDCTALRVTAVGA